VCYGEQDVENIGFDCGIAQGGESGLCEFPFAEAGKREAVLGMEQVQAEIRVV